MSNFFQHLALRALGQVRKSDAQPVVRSRFEPDSQSRRNLLDEVGQPDLQEHENGSDLGRTDQASQTNVRPRVTAGQAGFTVSASGRTAEPSLRASAQVVPHGDTPNSHDVASEPEDGPQSLELSEPSLAGATPSRHDVMPRGSKEPGPDPFSVDPLAEVPDPGVSVPSSKDKPRTTTGKSADLQDADFGDAQDGSSTNLPASDPASDLQPSGTVGKASLDSIRQRSNNADAAGTTSEGQPRQASRVSPLSAEPDRSSANSERVPSVEETESDSGSGDSQDRAARTVADPRVSVAGPRLPASHASRAGTRNTGHSETEEVQGTDFASAPSSALAQTDVSHGAGQGISLQTAKPKSESAGPSQSVSAPQVHIRIGRIEVRAPAPKPAMVQAPVPPPRTPSVSLSDYLKQTRGRG